MSKQLTSTQLRSLQRIDDLDSVRPLVVRREALAQKFDEADAAHTAEVRQMNPLRSAIHAAGGISPDPEQRGLIEKQAERIKAAEQRKAEVAKALDKLNSELEQAKTEAREALKPALYGLVGARIEAELALLADIALCERLLGINPAVHGDLKRIHAQKERYYRATLDLLKPEASEAAAD